MAFPEGAKEAHDIGALLRFMVEHGASDLFLSVGAPPSVKIHGKVRALQLPPLDSVAAKAMAYSVMR